MAGNMADLKFNEAQFFLDIQGMEEMEEGIIHLLRFESIPLDRLSYEDGRHALSEDYCFTLSIHCIKPILPQNIIHKKAVLRIQGEKENQAIHGIVTHLDVARKTHIGLEYTLKLNSPLYDLKLKTTPRVHIKKTAVDIIKEILERQGWQEGQYGDYEIRTTQIYPKIECCIQYEETDFDFLSRLLNRWGLFYYFENQDQTSSFGFKLIIMDSVFALPAQILPAFYRPGLLTGENLLEIWPAWQLLTDCYLYSDYDPENPTKPFQVQTKNNTDTLGVGCFHLHGENFNSLEQGAFLARIRQEATDWQREIFKAKSTYRGIRPGMWIKIQEHPEASLNGEYCVVSVYHQGDQAGAILGHQPDSSLRYFNHITLIKKGCPYRKPEHRPKIYQASLLGTLEEMDEFGNYYFRFLFDKINPQGQASPPTRQQQPLVGGGSDIGFYFPNKKGTQVEIIFINGDINRPVIAGALFDENGNIVTDQNIYESRLKTAGGNELLFNDKTNEESIFLATQDKKNIVKLDASRGKEEILIKTAGCVNINAQNGVFETEQENKINIGNNEITKVKHQYRLEVGQEINWEAGKNMELMSDTFSLTVNQDYNHSGNLRMEAENIYSSADQYFFEFNKDDLLIEAANGDIQFDIGKEAYLQGIEEIVFSNAGASITLRDGFIEVISPGTIRLESKNDIQILGQQSRGIV